MQDPVRPREAGKRKRAEVGERRLRASGYVQVKLPHHPNASVTGWVAEHTVVMSATLGRGLVAGENVHHRNGVKHDNRPDNLELWVSAQPAGQRVDDVVEWAEHMLRLYAPDKLAERRG